MKTVLMENLDNKMKEKNATNTALAHASGYSERTITYARNGKLISFYIAQDIWEALNKGTFQYKKRGRKVNGR